MKTKIFLSQLFQKWFSAKFQEFNNELDSIFASAVIKCRFIFVFIFLCCGFLLINCQNVEVHIRFATSVL